jgi:hypothetical protein
VTAKVVRFLPAAPAADRWAGALGRPGAPVRVALRTALDLPGLPPPRYAAVEVLWFARDGRADIGVGAALAGESADGAVAVAVEEVVGRGADALAARWADGGERFTMMSFGRRNPALTRAAFVERWHAEAGRLGGDRIPEALRGLAYVQDQPIGDDPPLDAINEVWFDRLDDLCRRAEWFAARPVPADLMSPPTCGTLYLRETVVAARR